MKKWFSFLILVCLLCSSVSSPVMAENINPDMGHCVEVLDNFTAFVNPRYPSETCLFETTYTNTQKAAILRDFLVERLLNLEQYQDELSIGKDGSSVMLYIDLAKLDDFQLYNNTDNRSDTKEIVNSAMSDIFRTPRLFWYGNYCVMSYKSWGGKVEKLGLKLNCYKDIDTEDGLESIIYTINALTSEFDGYVQSIVNLIPDNYSDYEKILFVNDYFCVNYKYDGNYSVYNAYEFFKEGTGVCQAYALAFMAVMDELDIKCDYVTSKEMNHGWNLIELNGKWYHVDVTWNDPTFTSLNTDMVGQATHKYFLLSSECIQDSEHEHYGFDIDSYGYEIGNEYDEVEVDLNRSLKSSFIELNGVWYNTGYDSDTRTCGLYAFNSPDITSITNDDLKTPLYNIGRWTTLGNRYYSSSYSYLTKYKDTILFNTPNSICMFDGNEVAELYVPEKEDDERIYGFTVKDDTIYIQLATDPNESGMKNATLQTVNLVDLIQRPLTIEDYNETTKQATIYAPEATEGVLFFASYDENDRLIDCKFMACSGDATLTTGINKCSSPDGFNTEGAEKVKVMLFENLFTLKPLCETYEIHKDAIE